MARPEEKAQAMMNKWVKMKEQGADKFKQMQASKKRPYLASLCEHLHECERFRRQIIYEISASISKIQNPGLGEHAIRDLNDTINKLIREKHHWNKRIVELGGTNYNKLERQEQLNEGDEQNSASMSSVGLKGSGGYRYFGAAKELPGVKELFARNAVKITKRKRGDIYKYITPDYYGLRDEEDGVLLEIEEAAALKRRKALDIARSKFQNEKQQDDYDGCLYFDSDDEPEGIGGVTGASDAIAAHVAVPTQEIVAQTILEKKRNELLASLS